ncbi:FtsH protease activity modulator HflK [Limnohabitans sp. Rim8]|uniref:FtsH protease activity modulator HflK n=1 Tax=Limnohabitans sp. Rim8 TaxID=1100718 RepID=UPI00263A35AF|nr:FtsH protease activity modulator HflK [Limnohabitans sp. Rim8]
MNFHLPPLRWSLLPAKIRGMFNLNDPRWGRDDDKPSNDSGAKPNNDVPPPGPKPDAWQQPSGRNPQQQSGPPDLDELWRDFNRKLGQIFGGNGGPQRPQGPSGSGGGSGGPEIPAFIKNLGIGVILGGALLVWLATGFFIVQEGQQAVITQFGKYHSTVNAGFNWRMPYPVQRHELVFVTQIRSVDIGRDNIIKATGLRESAMLTEDENIVEIKFAVQYRLNDARAYLFESRDPTQAVIQSAETAVREVVGKMRMDSALAEERDQIAPRVREKMQTILDLYKVGIEVVGINLQQGGVRPPEQVQSAFDDVLKAGQERERAKNEAQAYANDVVPRAVGAASRLKEEADAYRERIVAQAEGDSQRFKTILPEYQKAPQVMRDRMYTDTMQQIYSNVTKVLVDSKQGSNLLYLPLDKIMQQVSQVPPPIMDSAPATGGSTNSVSTETRSRDTQRSRDRDPR